MAQSPDPRDARCRPHDRRGAAPARGASRSSPANARTARALGTALAILGVALAAVATHAAANVGASSAPIGWSPPARARPLSRNPMYVAWTLVYAGAATLTGSGRTWALLPLVATAVHGTILREERSLADNPTLGAAYRDFPAPEHAAMCEAVGRQPVVDVLLHDLDDDTVASLAVAQPGRSQSARSVAHQLAT